MVLGDTVDGRADLYALGCVAYYLLTGQQVFEGADGLQMLLKRLHEDPPPPSTRVEVPIPADLERLVLACAWRAIRRCGRRRPAISDSGRLPHYRSRPGHPIGSGLVGGPQGVRRFIGPGRSESSESCAWDLSRATLTSATDNDMIVSL